jgi:hypothetical protein
VSSDEANGRRLATILAADAANYSRLMSQDDEATLDTLAGCKEVIAGLVTKHRGRIFSTAGDGVMIEFASVVQAVRCAVAVQHALERRNVDLPESRRMAFRIGIDVGDVIVREAIFMETASTLRRGSRGSPSQAGFAFPARCTTTSLISPASRVASSVKRRSRTSRGLFGSTRSIRRLTPASRSQTGRADLCCFRTGRRSPFFHLPT